jgi:hypothetical protein
VTGRDDEPVGGDDLLSEVNAHVHEAARRFEGTGPEKDHWEFTCECGAPDCRMPVSLTLAQYEALRAAGRLVLAPEHENSERPSPPA